MNARKKKGQRVLGALLLGTLALSAKAATSDSLTVTITPNAQYAVDVDTSISPALLDLGVVNLDVDTYTVNVTTVEVDSSYAATDLTIQAQVIAGGWSVDLDTTAFEVDRLQAWAVFTDTSVVTTTIVQAQPGAFDAPDLLQTTARDVGKLGAGNLQYMLTSGVGFKNMESIASSGVDLAASRSHLWLKFHTPKVTSTLAAQQVYVTVSAGAPN